MNTPSYEKLRAWQDAIALGRNIYDVTGTFPKSELFGLSAQMRRSAVSVASNIAEGSARNSRKEFAQFLAIALGSLAELDTQIILSSPLFIDPKTCSSLRADVGSLRRMLCGLKAGIATPRSTVNG